MTKFKVSVDDTEFQAACRAVSMAIMNLDATMKRMAESAVITPIEEADEPAGAAEAAGADASGPADAAEGDEVSTNE